MKTKSRAGKRDSASAAFSQGKIQPNGAVELPDLSSVTLRRVQNRRAGMVTILLQDENGKVLERVDMIDLLYNAVKQAARARGCTFKRFFITAIRKHVPLVGAGAEPERCRAMISPTHRARPGREITAQEFKVVALRECPLPDEMRICDTPDMAADYWRLSVANNPYLNGECECFVVLVLDTQRKVKGHQLISIGTMDTLLVHPREVFRGAIVSSASSIVLMHNHPSGCATPSEADIKITRDLVRAGDLLKIPVLDHIVMGQPSTSCLRGFCSLREMGYFYDYDSVPNWNCRMSEKQVAALLRSGKRLIKNARNRRAKGRICNPRRAAA